MKVFMLGWEFPPIVSGGLGVACYGLTKALNGMGVDVMFLLPRPANHSHEHANGNGHSAAHLPAESYIDLFSRSLTGGPKRPPQVHVKELSVPDFRRTPAQSRNEADGRARQAAMQSEASMHGSASRSGNVPMRAATPEYKELTRVTFVPVNVHLQPLYDTPGRVSKDGGGNEAGSQSPDKDHDRNGQGRRRGE